MKKLMTILAALSLFVPFANVFAAIQITDCAASQSCFVYTPGMEVNFYRSKAEADLNSTNAGISTVILEDGGKGEQYVKTLVVGSPYSSSVNYFEDGDTEPYEMAKKEHLSNLNKSQNGDYYWESARQDADGNIDLDYISLDELINVFGATKNEDGTYSIDAAKYGDVFGISVVALDAEDREAIEAELADKGITYDLQLKANKGFYTSTYDKDTNKVWVVAYALDKDFHITDITVKEENMNNNDYAYIPVVYFDKTYDCTSRVAEDVMACYSCDEDYRWMKVGSQAETCTLVENITSQGSCVKAVKTGVENYILEFVGIALVCGVALAIAKKKDLFRTI
ncbi:MAG: hypothetical protein J1F35_01425 [Erysipelotrichales bacterium]|nr:hypothetical protein [Erysipelotrichales bacterium]